MEPNESFFGAVFFVQYYIVPFAFFFVGIVFGHYLDHQQQRVRLKKKCMMGFLVSLIVVPTILFGALEAYQSHVLKYFLVLGIVAFQGVTVVALYERFRQQALAGELRP